MREQHADYIRSIVERIQDGFSLNESLTVNVILSSGVSMEASWIVLDGENGLVLHTRNSYAALSLDQIVGIGFEPCAVELNASDRRVIPLRRSNVLDGIILQLIQGRKEPIMENEVAKNFNGSKNHLAENSLNLRMVDSVLMQLAEDKREVDPHLASFPVSRLLEMINLHENASALKAHAEISDDQSRPGVTLEDLGEAHARHLADVLRYLRARDAGMKAYKPMIARDEWKNAISGEVNRAIGDV